ncbi:MAG: LPXTG cell wall anchor domain-containing protein, partial [Oscillospiraceae bacterium]|nr:LPXTG cell wall anchor domain-containing protein [Oscillospiraceae bacterium]
EATGHTWDEGVVTTEPTTDAEGEKIYTCSVCDETKVEPVDKLTPPADEEDTTPDDGEDEGTTTPPAGGESTTPDTGDNSMMVVFIIAAAICIGGIVFLTIKKKQLSK